jgi:hypothetical protein
MTPGIIGKLGKWPLKKGSSGETYLSAVMPSFETLITLSMKRKGSRCGSNFFTSE